LIIKNIEETISQLKKKASEATTHEEH
jgi:hypothetical protein